MGFGKRVERQLLKFLGSADGLAMIEALGIDPAIDPNLKKAVKGLPRFVDDVDKTYSQFEERLTLAVRNLEVSSLELTSANQNINSMLDSLGQGFLTFDQNGICSATYSKACETFFRVSPAGKSVFEILPLNEETQFQLRQWTQLAFEDRIDFADLETLAPARAHTPEGAILDFKYRLIRNLDETVARVVLIITDRTAEEQATTLAAAKSRYADQIVKLLTEKRHFAKFVRYFREVQSEYRNPLPPLGEIERQNFLRQIHTLKGSAGTFLMDEIQNQLHSIESKMALHGQLTSEELHREMQSLQQNFDLFLKNCASVIDQGIEDADELRPVSRASTRAFYDRLVAQASPLAEEYYRSFIAEDVASGVSFLQGQIADLATRLQKPMQTLRINTNDLRLDLAVFENLFATFTHAIRNSMDHGIETADIRVARGKAVDGQIKIDLALKNGHFEIQIEDDGNGLDPKVLAQKCASLGIAPPADLNQCIFEDGFSSASDVSDLSGRGIGMGALRAEARKLGGDAWVESVHGVFCRTCIKIPWSVQHHVPALKRQSA